MLKLIANLFYCLCSAFVKTSHFYTEKEKSASDLGALRGVLLLWRLIGFNWSVTQGKQASKWSRSKEHRSNKLNRVALLYRLCFFHPLCFNFLSIVAL